MKAGILAVVALALLGAVLPATASAAAPDAACGHTCSSSDSALTSPGKPPTLLLAS